jgi:anaphase-promoting complex subunit 8
MNPYPKLSQKSLFLALYAKYLAGEKRKEEETEMVLGCCIWVFCVFEL